MEAAGDSMPEGIIVNFHIAYTKEVLVAVAGFDRKAAGMLAGRKAFWISGKGQKYSGVVTGLHGTGSTIKVKFKNPLPQNALAKKILIAG